MRRRILTSIGAKPWVNPYQTNDGALKFMLDSVFSPPNDNKWVDSVGGRIIPLNPGSYNIVGKYIEFVSTAYGPDRSMVDGLGLDIGAGYTMQFVWKDGHTSTSNNGFIVSLALGIGSYWYAHVCRGIRGQFSNPNYLGKNNWHTWSFIWKSGLDHPSYRDKTFYNATYKFPAGPQEFGARIEIGSGGYKMYAASVRVFNRQLTEDEVFRFCDLDKEIYGLT